MKVLLLHLEESFSFLFYDAKYRWCFGFCVKMFVIPSTQTECKTIQFGTAKVEYILRCTKTTKWKGTTSQYSNERYKWCLLTDGTRCQRLLKHKYICASSMKRVNFIGPQMMSCDPWSDIVTVSANDNRRAVWINAGGRIA